SPAAATSAAAATARSKPATRWCRSSPSGLTPSRAASSTLPRSRSSTSACSGRRTHVPPDRRQMVERQLRGRDPRDARVLEAMAGVPRELFVPPAEQRRAYRDAALPIGHGQTISQPYMVARIAEALALHPGELALDVGTGSGYQAAVLAELGA